MPVRSIFQDLYIPDGVDMWEFAQIKISDHLDKLALVDSITEKSVSYREFLAQVNGFRAALWQIGMRKGDVLLVFSPNDIRTPVVAFAVFSIGGILTTCNPLYTKDELAFHLDDSGTKYVVTSPQFLKTVREANVAYASKLRDIIVYSSSEDGLRTFEEMASSDAPPAPVVSISPRSDVACLPYSSGTTGRPKGVMLTHYNLLANWYLWHHHEIRVDTNEPSGTIISFMPMYHIYGIATMITAMIVGKTLVPMPRFDFEQYLRLVQRYRTNQLYVVPPVATLLAKHPMVDKYDLNCVKFVFCGAAPLGVEIVEGILRRFPNVKAVRQGYGLTETSPTCHTAPLYRNPPGSVGFLNPNMLCKIIDIDTGEEVGCGKTGEICIKGPQVMKGYWNRPEATAATIDKDGWFHTGDIGYYDKDHYFYVTDRLKELIKYKGFQVAPATLEDLLHSHPAVEDVAVMGLPDEEAGELPCACIVLKKGHHDTKGQDIVNYVAAKVAPHMKLRGGVKFVEEIPKNPSGKILRRVLRERILPNYRVGKAKL